MMTPASLNFAQFFSLLNCTAAHGIVIFFDKHVFQNGLPVFFDLKVQSHHFAYTAVDHIIGHFSVKDVTSILAFHVSVDLY